MTITSLSRPTHRRVWNPSTEGLPAARSNEKICTAYWGLRQDYLMHDWMLRLRRMVAKKIPNVSSLDQSLRNLSLASMRVHGVASEQRDNRIVLGLDINGACSYAVAHEPIANPKYLTHRAGEECHPDDPAWSGFYLIEANAAKLLHTPPIPVRSAQGFFVSTQATYPFSLWVHSSEWTIWNTIFECRLVEGYEGPSMPHPLANVAKTLYAQRQEWSDKDAKMMLSTMHSCMGSRWSINDQPMTKAIWSLHNAPLGWVRGEWLRQWYRIVQTYPDALLCYANVDSMHWSIDATQYKQNPIFSDKKWGGWRTLFEGDQGVWLATGKYWIANKNTLVHHQNAGSPAPWRTKVRHRADTQPRGVRTYYSTCVWHGLGTPTKLLRKEKKLVTHILPTFKSVQLDHDLDTLRVRSVAHDRLWKKKLWFLLKRDCNEETQNS